MSRPPGQCQQAGDDEQASTHLQPADWFIQRTPHGERYGAGEYECGAYHCGHDVFSHGGIVMGTRCTCGQGHETFGACMRAKNIRVGYCRSAAGLDATAARDTTRELASYRAARDAGIQPAGTRQHQVDFAMEQSEKIGKPWRADEVGHD